MQQLLTHAIGLLRFIQKYMSSIKAIQKTDGGAMFFNILHKELLELIVGWLSYL